MKITKQVFIIVLALASLTGAVAVSSVAAGPGVPFQNLQQIGGNCSDSALKTHLLFTFVTNVAGFDTGFAISNTTSDPFDTTEVAETCTLSFFGATNAPTPVTTPSIAAGTTYTTLASTIAPNFTGYMITTCNFPLAHGFAFISDLGARNLAMGYLATNICTTRVSPR